MLADPWYETIFLFLEQIAPSWRHIFALIHARVVGSRVDVVTLHDQKWWELRVFTAMAGNKAGEEEPWFFYVLLCSELMDKVSFSRSRISLISRFEWIIREQILNNYMYWTRLSMISWIIETEVCVICRSRRLWQTDNTDTRFDNSWYHAKTEFNNCFIIHFSHNSCSETEAKCSAILFLRTLQGA